MKSIAPWRYPKYASRVTGSGDAVKSSNGVRDLTIEVTLFTRSCRRKKFTYRSRSFAGVSCDLDAEMQRGQRDDADR